VYYGTLIHGHPQNVTLSVQLVSVVTSVFIRHPIHVTFTFTIGSCWPAYTVGRILFADGISSIATVSILHHKFVLQLLDVFRQYLAILTTNVVCVFKSVEFVKVKEGLLLLSQIIWIKMLDGTYR